MFTFFIVVASIIYFLRKQKLTEQRLKTLEDAVLQHSLLKTNVSTAVSASTVASLTTEEALAGMSPVSVPIGAASDIDPTHTELSAQTSTSSTKDHADSFAATIAKVGVAVLIVGVAFFLKYINSLGLIGPNAKYLIGLIAGALMTWVAEKVKIKSNRYAHIVRGGGIVLWFMTLFTGTVIYHIVSLPITLTLITGVLIVTSMISLRERSETSFLIAVLGAYITPALMATFLHDFNFVTQLFSYIIVINIGIIIVSAREFWKRSIVVSFIATWLVFFTWMNTSIYSHITFFIYANIF